MILTLGLLSLLWILIHVLDTWNKFIVLQRAKRGQFQVVDQINNYLSYLQPGVDEAKAHLDHIIDLCGEAPKGKIVNELILYLWKVFHKIDFFAKVLDYKT